MAKLIGRRRRYDDISASIREHLEERTEELMEEGHSRQRAEQQARREFGNPTVVEQRSREAWQWQRVETLFADVRFALRRLARSPGFTVTLLLTLAIGIGANTSVFTVLDSVLLKPLAYPDSDRLVALHLNAPGAGGLSSFESGLALSPSMYFTFSEHNRSFSSLGVWFSMLTNLTGVAKPEQVKTVGISSGVLETLEIPPALGRWFNATDQDPRGSKTAMLSYGCWMRRFGGDPTVIGRTIQVDAQPREIVGVMPRGFRVVDQNFDLLLPLAFDPVNEQLAPFFLNGVARLKPGVTVAQADDDVQRLVGVWMDSWSNGPGSNPHWYEHWKITPALRPLKAQVVGNVSGILWVVMATIGLVMLIACTNVANLLLVRAESRHHELAIRSALGAGRARIARELLLESVLLGLIGGILSVGVAWAGLLMLIAAGPTNLPRLSEIALDARSLGFTLLLAVFSGLFFGAIPAWKYARSRTSLVLGSGSRTASAGRERQHSRKVLVVAQVAMALVLLVSALLMIRTFIALRHVNPGFADAARVQTLRISIPTSLIADPVMVLRTENEIADQIRAIPGVTRVGLAGAVPMEGIDPNWDQIIVEGKNYAGTEPPLRMFNYVAPGFFQTMGTRLIAGRDFNWDDVYGLRNNIIVSEGFARESWGSAAAAIGQRVKHMSDMPWQQVIGVVEDVRSKGVEAPAPATIYWPAMIKNPYTPDHKPDADWLRPAIFAVHSSRAGTESFVAQVQQAVWKVNANLPVASLRTMQDIYGQSMARTSFTLTMLALAGGMALALSIIGIYGVISYSVSQRTREIGIRLALGAQRSALRWMFVRSALTLTLAGVAIGITIAAVLTQLMRSLLFAISPLDPFTYLTVPLVLAGAATVASYLPAQRAAAVNPVESLRAE
ncbi:MAG TPA: ABC transporter permease [Acidobacteriaceae bacterium]